MHARIILIPVAIAYIMTSVLLLKKFAAMQMIVKTTATPNSKQARFNSFLCKGVLTLKLRKRSTASVLVRV
jgi:hypothetical protein